ncbi:diguanylate cyclase (GGDEF) domain-containing protein [Abditibacterium utsteinense]|uniref:diguanylate cyclase n=1 Tax=Abditibacterium utsteinense TaxID=1960156 RepID=A0A2S8SSS5_9BACT|nr:GGDEF domain-containing protein [Abditibacterium utsteinense]PQV63862.1 diguanylate cyclase (GGDEF) domain-containing protein [Abditibacterium utsteinense]
MATQNENRDKLTGVASWKYVSSILPGIIGHNGQVALILIDVDRLNHYNADFGTKSGDKQLIEIAREIETLSGESSLVFRYGGDEFGVILYEASLEQAREIAQRIRASFFVESNGKEVETLTLSLGIAHFPTHVSNAQDLLEVADLALLKTKRGGCLANGATYSGRNRAMTIGDFLDDFPEQSEEFLNHETKQFGN